MHNFVRWWSNLGFKEKLSFARDRLMENYLLVMGLCFEAQFSKCRIGLTKFVCILTAIDDMYDVYGSIDELELFTEAVKRWNTHVETMKIPILLVFHHLIYYPFVLWGFPLKSGGKLGQYWRSCQNICRFATWPCLTLEMSWHVMLWKFMASILYPTLRKRWAKV